MYRRYSILGIFISKSLVINAKSLFTKNARVNALAMDDTKTIENSINVSADQKINKRRSAVFKRQSIAPRDDDCENTEEISQVSKKFKLQKDESKFDIKKYIESLQEEDKKWHEVYTKRKSKVQDLSKFCKFQQQVGQSPDISVLSDSERAFLAAKPDYEEFHKGLFQLHTMSTKVTYLNLCAESFSENSTSKLQKDADHAVHRIINLTKTHT